MTRNTKILLVLTFLASFATILVERAGYFYARYRLGFSDAENLWLALAFGLAYIAGAVTSHPIATRVGEKRLVVVLVLAQVAVYAALTASAGPAMFFVCNALIGVLCGMIWPVVESYVGAGLTPRQTMPVIGRFNLAWASSIPLALLAAGPLIDWYPPALFAAGAVLWLACVPLIRPLPARPVHLPDGHPERPTRREHIRVRALLGTSRWLMLASYSTMWILAALMPRIFQTRLGFDAEVATGLSGLMDAFRLAAFLALQIWLGWHGRVAPLAGAMLCLPVGFLLVLFGGSLATVLVGEVLFGLAAGLVYYAALYYAMVAKNAAVEAGGGHEGLIGTGFAIGPAAGLLAIGLMPILDSEVLGMVAGIGPLLVLCMLGALRPMLRLTRAAARGHRI